MPSPPQTRNPIGGGIGGHLPDIDKDISAESWLNQQLQYDLWHAEKNLKRLRVSHLSAL